MLFNQRIAKNIKLSILIIFYTGIPHGQTKFRQFYYRILPAAISFYLASSSRTYSPLLNFNESRAGPGFEPSFPILSPLCHYSILFNSLCKDWLYWMICQSLNFWSSVRKSKENLLPNFSVFSRQTRLLIYCEIIEFFW